MRHHDHVCILRVQQLVGGRSSPLTQSSPANISAPHQILGPKLRASRSPPLRCWVGPSATSLCFEKEGRDLFGTLKIEEGLELERPEKVSKLAGRDRPFGTSPLEEGKEIDMKVGGIHS